jgi:hypothetical protein
MNSRIKEATNIISELFSNIKDMKSKLKKNIDDLLN